MVENNRKRPWLAAVLAMASPGLGHLYLREWLRAVLWFGLIFSAMSILVPTVPEPATMTVEAYFRASMEATRSLQWENRVALFALMTLSVADAYWMATRGNQQAAAEEGVSCPHCGKEVDESLDFCHWCTTPLEPREE